MFNQATADRICERLASGESLRKAAEAEGVRHSSVLTWVETIPAFADQYARAREIGYKLLADEIIEISDDSANDYNDTDRGPVFNAEAVARARLRVDSRKWMLSKMLPKVYGDKLDLNHSGTTTTVHRVELVALSGDSTGSAPS
jgi:hypothetical protein